MAIPPLLQQTFFDLFKIPSNVHHSTRPTLKIQNSRISFLLSEDARCQQECKFTKTESDEWKVVLHTFDGTSNLSPTILRDILFSEHLFPEQKTGLWNIFSKHRHVTEALGESTQWNFTFLDLHNAGKWKILDLGSQSNLKGAKKISTNSDTL